VVRVIENKYYFDEIYEAVIVEGIKFLSLMSKIFDIAVVDRFIPGSAAYLVKKMNRVTQAIQSGYIFNYALFMIMGVIVAITLSLLRFV
jgi:NADH-quinone oxidoreductase subunit L